MKFYVKRLFVQFLFIISLFVAVFVYSPVLSAQSAKTTFQLTPATSVVGINTTFDVAIELKSDTAVQVNYARAVITFDPTLLEISNTSNGTVFCQYPSDAANFKIDNANGKFMVTGISSGTASCQYPTINTTAVVFEKVTFKTKKAGTATVSFTYNGKLEDNQSGITKPGSPPVFVMTAPTNGTYTLSLNPSGTPTVTPSHGPKETGFVTDNAIYIGAVLYAIGIGFFVWARAFVADDKGYIKIVR